jgi:cytochrome c-type biogenesis protein CcmF
MEHTFLSSFGYALVFLAFVTALLSSVAYFISVKNEETPIVEASWKKLGRISFLVHAFAMLSVVGLVFWMLINHYYEFNYIWKYSNNSMPMKYVFACFWGGQEGSFMLWMFWNVVIGLLIVWRSKKWEASVMATFGLIQVFLVSMILGVYVFDLKIGSNPFVLTRMLPENLGLPWTELTDYMTRLPHLFADGKGLNPLLRNYWMTIHPPTLFLGFALTAVPFCYAIAGLWRRKMIAWIKPALPWTFVGVGILGVGILMGGAWAYEALSFGGFWAWDPVENVSYIPWLTFLGAGHLMLVNKRKNSSVFFLFILTFLSFILVLYSTFLTRSGVLGDSSVHSFTDNGMLGQLLLYIVFFVWLSVFSLLRSTKERLMFSLISVFLFAMALLADYEIDVMGISPAGVLFLLGTVLCIVFMTVANIKYFPRAKDDEGVWSREFWMFLGALVLLIACGHIFYQNSFPVWNKLFNNNAGKPEPYLLYYNNWQGFFAIFVAFFIGFTQFLRYKSTPFKVVIKNVSFSLITSIVLTVILSFVFDFSQKDFIDNTMLDEVAPIIHTALLFSSIYAVVGNLDYWLRFLKGKLNFAGSSIAHIGFGLILFGALISNSQSKKLSHNKAGKFDLSTLSDTFKNDEDAQLTLGDTTFINEYFVLFQKRTKEDMNVIYAMDYFEKIKDTNAPKGFKAGKKLFTLNPFVQINEKFGNVAEPSTKHYIGHDVFTHIKYPNPSIFEGVNNGYMPFENMSINLNDTIYLGGLEIIANSYNQYPYLDNDIAGSVNFTLNKIGGDKTRSFDAVFMVKGDTAFLPAPAEMLKDLEVKFGLSGVSPPFYDVDSNLISQAKFSIDVAEKEYVIMQAKTFPLINLLWIGCILMLIGSTMAAFYRVKRSGKRKV